MAAANGNGLEALGLVTTRRVVRPGSDVMTGTSLRYGANVAARRVEAMVDQPGTSTSAGLTAVRHAREYISAGRASTVCWTAQLRETTTGGWAGALRCNNLRPVVFPRALVSLQA